MTALSARDSELGEVGGACEAAVAGLLSDVMLVRRFSFLLLASPFSVETEAPVGGGEGAGFFRVAMAPRAHESISAGSGSAAWCDRTGLGLC